MQEEKIILRNPTDLRIEVVVNHSKYTISPKGEPGYIQRFSKEDGTEITRVYDFIEVIDENGTILRVGPPREERPWLYAKTKPNTPVKDDVLYARDGGSVLINGIEYVRKEFIHQSPVAETVKPVVIEEKTPEPDIVELPTPEPAIEPEDSKKKIL